MIVLTWLAIISDYAPFHYLVQDGSYQLQPQRVMRQLGYDQSAVQVTGKMGCSNTLKLNLSFCAKVENT